MGRVHFYFISGTIAVVVVSLGTMSFIRRLLRRHSNRVTTACTASTASTEDHLSVLDLCSISSRESSVDVVPTKTLLPDSAHTDSTPDESCLDTSSEMTHRNVDCRRKRRKLSSLLRRKGKKEMKLDRKQREILQIDAEIKEVLRMLKHIDVKEVALDEEVQFKKLELISMFPVVAEDAEKDVKRKEALYHKRFTNIKSATDAKNLLTMIRTRKYALEQLELLTYRKYVSIQHNVETKDKPTVVPPLNPSRPTFDHLFNTIRERIAQQQQQPGGEFAYFDAAADDIFPAISGSGSSTHNRTLQLRMNTTHASGYESIV